MATTNTVHGVIGNDSVELNNMASEDTLKKMLETIVTLNNNIIKLPGLINSSSSTSGTNTAANELIKLGGTVASVITPMQGITKLLGNFASSIGFLTGAIVGVGQAATNVASELIDGKATISGFFDAFKNMPFFIGEIASLFSKITKLQEAELDTYIRLSNAGMDFAGSLTQIRQSALSFGLDLQSYGTMLSNPKVTSAFALMGGTIESSRKDFEKFMKTIRDSDLGMSLRSLGFTTQQMFEGAASFIKSSGGTNIANLKNSKDLTNATGEYLKQLDLLARITNKSRSTQEDESIARHQNDAWQTFLSQQGKEASQQIIAFIDQIAQFSEGAASYYKGLLLDTGPLLPDAQHALGLFGDGLVQAKDQLMSFIKSGPAGFDTATKRLIASMMTTQKSLGLAGSVISNMSGELQKPVNDVFKVAKLVNAAGGSADQLMKNIQEARQNANATHEQTLAAVKAKQALESLGEKLYIALEPVLAPLSNIILNLAESSAKFIVNKLPILQEKIEQEMPSILASFEKVSNFVGQVFTESGRNDIVNEILFFFKKITLDLLKAIGPSWFGPGIDDRTYRKKLKEAEDELSTQKTLTKVAASYNKPGFVALTLVPDPSKQAKLNNQIASLTSQVQTLEKQGKTEELKNLNDQLTELKDIKAALNALLAAQKENNSQELLSPPAPTSPKTSSSTLPAIAVNINNPEIYTAAKKMISEGEGTTPQNLKKSPYAKSVYDIIYGHNAYAEVLNGQRISELPLAEVYKIQRKLSEKTKGTLPDTNLGTSAVGKYQFIEGTLRSLAKEANMDPTKTTFNDATQEKLADLLLKRYIKSAIAKENNQFKFSPKELADRLYKEWPNPNVQSNAADFFKKLQTGEFKLPEAPQTQLATKPNTAPVVNKPAIQPPTSNKKESEYFQQAVVPKEPKVETKPTTEIPAVDAQSPHKPSVYTPPTPTPTTNLNELFQIKKTHVQDKSQPHVPSKEVAVTEPANDKTNIVQDLHLTALAGIKESLDNLNALMQTQTDTAHTQVAIARQAARSIKGIYDNTESA